MPAACRFRVAGRLRAAAPYRRHRRPRREAASRLPTLATAKTGFDWEHLIAGRWLNRVGLTAVAIGVAYFLKHAIDNDWIGPRGQVALGLLLGVALLASAPWFVKKGLVYFAEGLTGLGAAILYLSLWAAGSYYGFLSPPVTFVAMAIVTAAMLAIAIGRNSPRIAALAMAGGFVTPALVSTGRDAQVALFSYLALHNAALLVLAWTRQWRFLELPGLRPHAAVFLGLVRPLLHGCAPDQHDRVLVALLSPVLGPLGDFAAAAWASCFRKRRRCRC